ncbi:MAG: hypothetical protein ACI4D8_08710 [Wujia sp.]
MKYLGLIIFLSVFLLVFLIARAITYSNSHVLKAHKEFIQREAEANSVRRADISNLDYLVLDPDSLPTDIAISCALNDEVNELKSLSKKKILNLSAYTNTDLKLMYGPANLDALSDCDANFTSLIRCLDKIGTTLYCEEKAEAAKAFLSYSIDIGSDITNTYVTLGKIYADCGDRESLNSLIKRATKISSLSGPTIKGKLEALKAQSF